MAICGKKILVFEIWIIQNNAGLENELINFIKIY